MFDYFRNALSMISVFGFLPLFTKFLWGFVVVAKRSADTLLFNDCSSVELESWLYMIMINLYPLIDVTVKHLVLSLKNFPFSWMTLV